MKNNFKVMFGLFLGSAMLLSACGGNKPITSSSASEPEGSSSSETSQSSTSASTSTSQAEGAGVHTYKEYVTVSPSNWNELTYRDANDQEIMSYINGSFYTFNYDFDGEGKIIDGGYQVEFDGATALEDVTATYAGDANFAVPAAATNGYAYKLTLRDDLKWDDGTSIKAKDFVYTMKEQLNPLFRNYRADSYYIGGTIIHNAMNYAKQGQTTYVDSNSAYATFEEAGSHYDNLIFHCSTDSTAYDGGDSYFMKYVYEKVASKKTVDAYGGIQNIIKAAWGKSFSEGAWAALEGKTMTQIQADATLAGYLEEIYGWWVEVEAEKLNFFVSQVTFPEVNFEDVGIFVGDTELELVLVLDKPLELLNEDGELCYKAAYNLASLPLVKEDLYEANKVAPTTEGGLWTTTYNSSVESSASWGPYKLTYFQAGKQFILERNENWYGYKMPEYAGQYETDRIVCDTIASWNTAWLLFKQGDIQGIGIDPSIAAEYKNSQRARFTADDYVGSMQLQSSEEALANRSSADANKMLLTYADFRKALSLAIDRADYCSKVTTASLAGFGLFNSMHYYDVENGGVYRNEDVAKKVICEVYGINIQDYDSLDEAYAAVTGFNLTLSRELLSNAYTQALADGKITDTDKVKFTLGTAAITEGTTRQFNYLDAAFKEMAVGTALEGRISLELKEFGDSWAEDFREGAYDICTGGWSGAAWDPGYFLLAYLSPDYMYSSAWDTSSQMLTFNPYADDNEDHIYTMSLMDWYDCLNGNNGARFNWAEGQVSNAFRLRIIAALEKEILLAYYTVPMYNYFTASLTSYKVENGSKTYNTFMGYGGIRYMTYNYDDAEWEVVKGTFDYKL